MAVFTLGVNKALEIQAQLISKSLRESYTSWCKERPQINFWHSFQSSELSCQDLLCTSMEYRPIRLSLLQSFEAYMLTSLLHGWQMSQLSHSWKYSYQKFLHVKLTPAVTMEVKITLTIGRPLWVSEGTLFYHSQLWFLPEENFPCSLGHTVTEISGVCYSVVFRDSYG